MHPHAHTGNLIGLVRDKAGDDAETMYRIGELSREFSVTLRTLRFYEDRKLLSPKRVGSTRLYSAADRERLKLILLAKRSGFSLSEIEEILEVNDQDHLTRDATEKLIDKFKRQVGVLSEQKKEIDEALDEIGETISYLESQL
ncbi:MAG: MerR family DNA-binding transcriptional regulator [Phyllobacteriaceae bacterium]|nr:MerR family DNA-binding transcriptional regulator [Phyllobacteriaceae bacterium]